MGQNFSKSTIKLSDSSNFQRELGVISIVVYHRIVLKLVKNSGVNVPPVLISILGVLGGLECIKRFEGKQLTDTILKYFDPAADWLGYWMPLWLAPPLVTLPNALLSVKGADRKTWIKVAVVHLVCWIATVLGTSQLFALLKHKKPNPSENTKEGNCEESTSADENCKDSTNTTPLPSAASNINKKMKILKFWGAVAVSFYVASSANLCPTTPALAATSIAAMTAGDLLPPAVKTVLHPVITTAVVSAVASIVLHRLRGQGSGSGLEGEGHEVTWQEALRLYFSNGKVNSSGRAGDTAGDVFFSMLGPCCVGLSLRIFSLLQLPEMQEALPAVLTASGSVTLLSLLLSPYIGKLSGLPSELSSPLAHRSITTSLAVPSAQVLGASPELTVAAVLISGLYGTSAEAILDMLGVTDDVAKGVTMGMASHSLGTAALMSVSRTASASASMTMFAAGIFHAVACSIPVVRKYVKLLS
eukprot:gene1625-3145_t